MKKNIYVILIILLCHNYLAFAQKKEIQMIQIEYIDFTTLTDSKINCDNFELAGDYKTIIITNRKKINSFVELKILLTTIHLIRVLKSYYIKNQIAMTLFVFQNMVIVLMVSLYEIKILLITLKY